MSKQLSEEDIKLLALLDKFIAENELVIAKHNYDRAMKVVKQ